MLAQRCWHLTQPEGQCVTEEQCEDPPGPVQKSLNFHCSHYSLPNASATGLRQNLANSVTDV
eukprot:2124455-Rhodomonas_salina.2